jgi:hypothetical protein
LNRFENTLTHNQNPMNHRVTKPGQVFVFAFILSAVLASGIAAAPLPDTAPAPALRPIPETRTAAPVPAPAPRRSVGDDAQPAPPPVEANATERACRKRLRTLGVSFRDTAPVRDPAGCRIDHPVLVRTLSPQVALRPPALLNCAIAETAARFVRDVAAPVAARRFAQPLAALHQVSGYVCRPRNGSAKLSEHAFGNAIDLSAFELADGTRIEIGKPAGADELRFLRSVRGRACGPFKTVLGPGADADHATHFHFDLAERRSGATFCQ